jgi:chromosome partitioning protein
MKTICFSSLKGGTGKSSLSILTANHVAAAGYQVLVVDLDIQNSATFYYLDRPEDAERKNISVALRTGSAEGNILATNYMGVDLLASSLDLLKLRNIDQSALSEVLTGLPYDFIIIDTAPTYDRIVLAGIVAADLILTPTRFTRFDYKGAVFMRDQIGVETSQLPLWRVLFNFYRPPKSANPDSNRNLFESMFRETFGDAIVPITIPESSLVPRAIDTAEMVTTANSKAALHRAIQSLAAYCGAERGTGRF